MIVRNSAHSSRERPCKADAEYDKIGDGYKNAENLNSSKGD